MLELLYPHLNVGCVGAWCPSVDRSRSTLLTDQSGYGNNGTLTNMDPATDWVASEGKVALDFDGVNDYVNCGNIQTITTGLTIAIWFYRSASTLSVAIGRYGISSMRGYGLFQYGVDNKYYFLVSPNGSTEQGVGSISADTVFGTWISLIGTYSPNGCILYRNGTPVVVTDFGTPSSIYATSQVLEIGKIAGIQARCQIDDIRIYNRALPAAQVKQLYEIGRGGAYATKRKRVVVRGATLQTTNKASSSRLVKAYPHLSDGLVGAWCPSRDNSRSTLLTDFSGYGNNGVLTNGPTWQASDGKVALNFDGTNDYVVSSKNIGITSSSNRTVTCWVNMRINPPLGYCSVFQWGVGSAGNTFEMLLTSSLCILHTSGGGNAGASIGGITLNKWIFVVVGNIGLNGFAGVNNQLYTATYNSINTTNSTLKIGGPPSWAGHNYFSGQIDDIRIYNRALPAAQVKQLYEIGRGGAYQMKRIRTGKRAAITNRNNMLMGVGL